MQATHFSHPARQFRPQRGIALIVVMVMLLLGTILVLGATRTSWLNEIQVGNESDYQRAYAAAEAMISDAETDIRGRLPGGALINPGNPVFHEDSGRRALEAVFPNDDEELGNTETFIDALPAGPTLRCRQGICVPASVTALGNWWDNPANLLLMQANAATYRQFTTTAPPAPVPPPPDNPLLNGRAWYWVEVFRHDGTPGPRDMPIPDASSSGQPYFFRITALVQGQKPGTRVILRSVFVPKPQAGAT